MARIQVDIEEVDDIENEHGDDQKGVRATCLDCDHVTESFGQGPKSRMRCLILMKEECPVDAGNFYVDSEA